MNLAWSLVLSNYTTQDAARKNIADSEKIKIFCLFIVATLILYILNIIAVKIKTLQHILQTKKLMFKFNAV
jgi:hypothetical protein